MATLVHSDYRDTTASPALSALIRKRAELAGEAEALDARLAQMRADLAHLDAAIRILCPEAEPELISIESVLTPLDARGWIEGPLVDQVSTQRGYRLELDGPGGERSVVIFKTGETLSAFVNECAHQGLPIDGGLIDPVGGTVTCPWHGFCFDSKTGECLTAPEAQLEPLPLQVRDGRVFVRVGG